MLLNLTQSYFARQEMRPHPKPFEEEKSICDCLIQYLEPLMAVCSSEIEESDGNKTTSKYLDGELKRVLWLIFMGTI